METERVQVVIKGRVQGVFFRASTSDMAHRLGLKGCVRNLPDGSVEAIFEGPKDTLKQAIQWCRKGPAGAYVDRVEEKWSANKKEFDGFDITY
jgi:acylphosphatase